MTNLARPVFDPPAHGPYRAWWSQPYRPGVDNVLDWYVETAAGTNKVQRSPIAHNVMLCEAIVAAGTTTVDMFDGAPSSPATGWTAPTLTGLVLEYKGHDGCTHQADLTDTAQQTIIRSGHVSQYVRRDVASKITDAGGGTQAVGTSIFGHRFYLTFRADLPDVVEIEAILHNGLAEIETQGQGVKAATAPHSTGYTSVELKVPAGWALLAERPIPLPGEPLPPTEAGYVSNAHCFPRKGGTTRVWVIYKTSTATAQQAQDVLELKGWGRATSAGLRSFHSERAYGPTQSVLPDLGMGYTGGYAAADAQALNAYNTLRAVSQSGGTGGGTGGEFGEGFTVTRMGLFHPVGEPFPGAPAGADIEVFCGKRLTRNGMRYNRLHASHRADGCAVFLHEKTTGKPLASRDFAAAYTGAAIPGFVTGPAGTQPFQCATQNDSGYEYKVQRVQTFGGWTPRESSWPSHFLANDSGQFQMYKRWWPKKRTEWGTPARSLWDFKCNYRPLLEQVPVPLLNAAGDVILQNGQPTYAGVYPHKESAPLQSLQSGYTHKDPPDAQHAVRMFTKLIPLAWHTGSQMAIDLLRTYAEWLGLEYTECGTLDLIGSDNFTIAGNNLSLKRRLAIQNLTPHTARYGVGRAEAWAGFVIATDYFLTPEAERLVGYAQGRGIQKRAEMFFDYITVGAMSNGHTQRIGFPGESGSTDRAFGGGAHASDGPPIPSTYDIAQAGLELPKVHAAWWALGKALGRTEHHEAMLAAFTDYVARTDKYTPYFELDNGVSINGQRGPFNCVATWNDTTNAPEPGSTAPRAWIGSGGHFDDVCFIVEVGYRLTGDANVFTVANLLGNPAPASQSPAQRAAYWLNGYGGYQLGMVGLMQTLPGADPEVEPPQPFTDLSGLLTIGLVLSGLPTLAPPVGPPPIVDLPDLPPPAPPPAPTFRAIRPTSGQRGTRVEIIGAGFAARALTATLGGLTIEGLTVVDDRLLRGRVPQLRPGPATLVITTGAGTVTVPDAFLVTAPPPAPLPPVVASMTPTSGLSGTPLTLGGVGFSVPGLAVDVGELPLASLTLEGDTVIRGIVPRLAPGEHKVKVRTNAGETNAPSVFTVTAPTPTPPPPVITSLTPTSGRVGALLHIVGTGFSADTFEALLGNTPLLNLAREGDTLITGSVPPIAPGLYTLTVNTSPGGSGSLPNAFTVLPEPPPGPPPVADLPNFPTDPPPPDTPPTPPGENGGAIPDALALEYTLAGLDPSGDNVLIAWSPAGGDVRVVGADLARESGLASAVLISLFTDRRADADPLRPLEAQDLRGWWGESAGDPFGSRLWQLEREKQLPQTLARAREAVEESLDWMRRDGIARRIDVEAQWGDRGLLVFGVRIYRGTARRWARLWGGVTSLTIRAGGVLLNVEGLS